jgi:hypothetical protein
MIDWLRRAPEDSTVEIAGRALPVAIRRHPTASRMTLRLAPDGSEARVTIPRWGRTADALAFARDRTGWLAAQIASIPQPVLLANGISIAFRGEPLTITWRPGGSREPVRDGNELRLGGPEDRIPARVKRWLAKQATGLMEGDLADYCTEAGIAVPALRLTNARRRWGSCSSGGTVRINWRLVMAPDHVRRSVVAHEIAHLVHFDHSREFHALLAQLYGPDLDRAERWLREHGRTLYAPFG